MPGPMTVVTFRDADGDEFPITLVGRYETMEAAISAANGVLTQARAEGKINPTMPVTLDVDHLPYEWGGTISADAQRMADEDEQRAHAHVSARWLGEMGKEERGE